MTGTSSSRSFHTSATTRLSTGNWRWKNSIADHDVAATVTLPTNGIEPKRNRLLNTDSVEPLSKSQSADASKLAKKAHKAEVSMI